MASLNRFSIFLPVRNGGKHFQECIDSVLSQTYEKFDLTVLDNSSEDASVEWLRDKNDSRVTIIDSPVALSIEENWRRILDAPKNEFMTIIGHDDLFDNNYLATMSNLIDKKPDAKLYQAHFRLIDENGKVIRSCLHMPEIETADSFLASRLSFSRDSFGTGYMFRSTDYENVGGIPNYKNLMFSDDALWIRLMNDSIKVTVSEECFSYRVHKQSTSYAPDWRVLFEALKLYLEFLKQCGLSNQLIKELLHNELQSYVIFFFQLTYFSIKNNSDEKKEVAREINRMCEFIMAFLPKERQASFVATIQRRVFGKFAYYYWMSWRGRKWIQRKLRI